MTISEDEMLQTETRKCCDYAAYEKLQNLVFSGAVKKHGKIYMGNSAALAAMVANAPHAAAITSNA